MDDGGQRRQSPMPLTRQKGCEEGVPVGPCSPYDPPSGSPSS